jgi:hypothetical protein
MTVKWKVIPVVVLASCVFIAAGDAYAGHGGGPTGGNGTVGEGGARYNPPAPQPTKGTSKPINCKAGGGGCQHQH